MENSQQLNIDNEFIPNTLENFRKNIQYAIGLIQFIPNEEKFVVKCWIEKLLSEYRNKEELICNEYAWFLVIQLENGILDEPFIRNPPKGSLDRIKKSMVGDKYQNILKLVDDVHTKYRLHLNNNSKNAMTTRVLPFITSSEFLKKQPAPNKGFMVYGCCFSNQD